MGKAVDEIIAAEMEHVAKLASAPDECVPETNSEYALRARLRAARDALERLASAEASYRVSHDRNGADDVRTGRAWDEMRRAGDNARTVLKGS